MSEGLSLPEGPTRPRSTPKSDAVPDAPAPKTSAFQRFVTTYSTFLSSFVIGAAGLVATTVYQSKQQEMTRRQAEAQIKMSEVAAENQWRIERAEILSKNLSLLASSREDTVDQRYGVLLSLTRGKIIDPELAVAYALELGVFNPGYMRSILATVGEKDYLQLDHSYQVSCEERYGLSRNVGFCKNDRYAERSQALSEVIAEELGAGNRKVVELLADERQVKESLQRRAGLFSAYLDGLYQRRQIGDIERFEAMSPGARLVAALVLAADRDGELTADDETAERARFHESREKWLESYLIDRRCDAECKGRLADFMFTDLGLGDGTHEHALAAVLQRPDAESTHVKSRLHVRLLWCRTTNEAAVRLRDRILVPVATRALEQGSSEGIERLKDLLELVALVPLPEANARDAWYSLLERVRQRYPAIWRDYLVRRLTAERQRQAPPRALSQGNFCNATEEAQPVVPEME
ncbi:MAG TPA: hypothetical protein VH877_25850 [Polyangia bacterium]|jgi:hypothetical protein|nr:hypothetical protein [Polyangia bacterium]